MRLGPGVSLDLRASVGPAVTLEDGVRLGPAARVGCGSPVAGHAYVPEGAVLADSVDVGMVLGFMRRRMSLRPRASRRELRLGPAPSCRRMPSWARAHA